MTASRHANLPTGSGPLAPEVRRALDPGAGVQPDAAQAHLEAVLGALNEPQRQAATRGDGPLLVVAGPGAGKTRAIIARVTHLVVARGVPPRQVTAITFSRRAAGELQARLEPLRGVLSSGGGWVWAGTFHALGARILRLGGAALFERPPQFTIFDRDDTEQALRRLLAAMDVPQSALSRLVTASRQAVSLAKRRREPPSGEVTAGDAAVSLPDLFRRYEDELHASAAFDFDDLVATAAGALERDAALRERVQGGCRHLLVDEYQDTDPAQEAMLRLLSPPPHDVCVVADPQQSIYAFRGAVPEQVQRFVQRWPKAGVVRLEQNYRSTKSIVALARRLGAATSVPRAPSDSQTVRQVLGLRLWTLNPAGSPARLWVAPHPEKEAEAIATDIAARVAAGWLPETVAVLVRTHQQARPIEAALLRAGVPYALVGGVRFYGREEVKDALAYLRLAALPGDTAAFWRVVNTPRRGLGPAALLAVARHTLAAGGGSLEGARHWAASDGAPDGLYDFLAHVDELASMDRAGAPPRRVLEAALKLTGYRDHVRRQHPDDAAGRLEALDELLRIADGHEDSRRFLDEAVLSAEEDDPGPASAGRVRLSTVHAAKGLEFRAVYVPGCEVGLFPLAPRERLPEEGNEPAAGSGGQRSTAVTHHYSPGADPEERRVFYVAVTRAREALTLSYCTFRRDGRTQPSPYLREIGSGLLRRARLGSDEPPPARKPRKATAARPAKAAASAPGGAPAGGGAVRAQRRIQRWRGLGRRSAYSSGRRSRRRRPPPRAG